MYAHKIPDEKGKVLYMIFVLEEKRSNIFGSLSLSSLVNANLSVPHRHLAPVHYFWKMRRFL